MLIFDLHLNDVSYWMSLNHNEQRSYLPFKDWFSIAEIRDSRPITWRLTFLSALRRSSWVGSGGINNLPEGSTYSMSLEIIVQLVTSHYSTQRQVKYWLEWAVSVGSVHEHNDRAALVKPPNRFNDPGNKDLGNRNYNLKLHLCFGLNKGYTKGR